MGNRYRKMQTDDKHKQWENEIMKRKRTNGKRK